MRSSLDLSQRVHDAPSEATVRGVWFGMIADHVRDLGAADLLALRSAVPRRTRVPFLQYSLREYLEELAIAGGIIAPNNPIEGIRAIWRDATMGYTRTAFGRSLVRLLRYDPSRYMTWMVNHRDHFCNYGNWSISKPEPHYVVMYLQSEYIWIDSAHRGGAEGLLDAFGVQGTVEPELTNGPYEGRLHIRWRPHH
jgi:uncharacterized protein (TIGR02265 family)